MKLKIGFDDEVTGHIQIREGRAEFVAGTPGACAGMEEKFDLYARLMVTDGGHDAEKLTAEDVLRFMATRMNGRSWAVLAD